MPKDATAVAVTSRSFSRDVRLRDELLSRYSDVRFNDEGASLAGADLVAFLVGCRGAITGLERVDDSVLASLPLLAVVSRVGVGVDMLDLEAFERRGVRIARAVGTNSRSVAELVILLILGVLRRLPEVQLALRSQRWEQPRGRELTGKAVGIVGLGNVGREVAGLLAGFGCIVRGFDTTAHAAPNGLELVDLDTLLKESDIVTLHVPFTASTEGMIGPRELGLMKPDAVIVNAARGGLIVESALVQALDAGRLAGAGLDVLASEPPTDDSVIRHPKVLTTSHIGGSTDEAVYAMGKAAIDGLDQALSELRAGGLSE